MSFDEYKYLSHSCSSTTTIHLLSAPFPSLHLLFAFEMRFSSFLLASFAISGVFAAPKPSLSAKTLSKRCTNSADDRSCWGDYDISTNYYDTVPDTGVTREYWFDIQNGTASPDGVERVVLTVNGSFPGPTIIADWGDTVGE
jgi:hypothetical protein